TSFVSTSPCVTSYVADATNTSPGNNVIFSGSATSSPFTVTYSISLIPSSSSTRFTLFNVVLPVFVAVNVYVIVSPATNFSFSPVFLTLFSDYLQLVLFSSFVVFLDFSGFFGSLLGVVLFAVACWIT